MPVKTRSSGQLVQHDTGAGADPPDACIGDLQGFLDDVDAITSILEKHFDNTFVASINEQLLRQYGAWFLIRVNRR